MADTKLITEKKRKQMFYVYIVFLGLLAVAIAFMPMASAARQNGQLMLVVSGSLFWVGLIGTVCTATKITRLRRSSMGNATKAGLFLFFSNGPAKIFDILMGVSGLLLVIVWLLFNAQQILFVCLSIFLFSFGMHCMLNGANYMFLTNKQRRKK